MSSIECPSSSSTSSEVGSTRIWNLEPWVEKTPVVDETLLTQTEEDQDDAFNVSS